MGEGHRGEALGVQAVIDTVIPITFIHLKLKPGANYVHACEQDHNVMLYAFGGSMDVEGRSLHDGGLGLLSQGTRFPSRRRRTALNC